MKFCGLLMITVLFQLSLFGQSQTVTFSGKNISLKEIFAIIKSQTGVFFFYDASLLQDAKPVTIKWKNVTLEMALNETLKRQGLSWVLEDKTVTVVRSVVRIPSPFEPASQDPPSIHVRGRIMDGQSNPISGVTVVIKDTKHGTVSDNSGKFFIEAHPKNVLIFSAVNYHNKEMQVDEGEMDIQLQLDVKPMELLLVGGNLTAIRRKADATSVTVLDSKTLEKIPGNTLEHIFRGWVPGTNSFNVGDEPEGFPSLIIRGAAGPVSLAAIAVYIDGIEYAGGSGYLSQLDKSNIDRIEIVKGPGAATMYGTGSNGGIVQIFTKKGSANQSIVNFTTGAGFYKSKWVESNPFQQMHNLETTTNFKNFTIKLGGSYRTVDAYLPDGGEKNKGFYGSARFIAGKLQANISGRYNVRNLSLSRQPFYDTATHPRTDLLIEVGPGNVVPAYLLFNIVPTASRNKNGIAETTFTGLNLSHKTSKSWVNNLDAGYTLNASSELPMQNGVTPLQRQYSSEKYNITTIRYSNVLTLRNIGNGLAAIITSGAEYKNYSSSVFITRATTNIAFSSNAPDNENYGAFVQLNPSYKNVYLTMGLRYENNKLFNAVWNPRIGLTTNFDTRSLTIKPRISWGKGITPPSYQARFGSPRSLGTIVYDNPDIKPQSQQGFDYGLELYDKKGKYKFEVVYYDNILKNMLAEGAIVRDPRDSTLFAGVYINGGKIANKGWEFSGEYQLGRFHLEATFSIFNSRVKDTTGTSQTGSFSDKPPGTRMVHIPRHTAGINLAYDFRLFGNGEKGVVSLSITEMVGIEYIDTRTYWVDVAYGRTPYIQGVTGYPVKNSVFRVGVYADHYIIPNLRLFIHGANILNDYEYEYRDSPSHGATWLFGLKYNFSKANN